MADSNITKRALAAALKELMEEKPFSKISVGDICDRCGMNRKSFYYHFRDKYDLVNWIFDVDFLSIIQNRASEGSQDLVADMCRYFYDNRSFYRKALKVEGQNSFLEHFRELLYVLIRPRLHEIVKTERAGEFQVNFFSDAIVMTIQRWLLTPNCMEPGEFLTQLEICIQCIANHYNSKNS